MPTLSPGKSLGEVAEIIHAAVVLGPAAWGREPMPEAHMAGDIEEKLKAQLIALFRILHERNIPYVLVGGIAMLTYIDGRNTRDVDLVLSVESLKLLPEILILDQNHEFAHGKLGELLVDFLFTDNPLFKIVARKYSRVHSFLEMDLQTATIEGLILLKMFALPSLYRQRRRAKVALYENDIQMLYDLTKPEMDPLFHEVEPFVDASALVELRAIVAEMQQRIRRMDKAGE